MTKSIKYALILLFMGLAPLSADTPATSATPQTKIDLPEPKQDAPSPAETAIKKQQTDSASQSSQNSQNSKTADDDDDISDSDMPMPSSSPMKVPDNGYSKQFTGTLIAVIVIIFLIFLVIWLMRRFSNTRPLHMNHRKHIKILERRPLSPNTYVYLLKVGDKQFVIAESKFQVHNVANLDWNETEAD